MKNKTDAQAPVIVWFRNDLRCADNPALRAAADLGVAVIPVFICDNSKTSIWRRGGAAKWWLHHSLKSLSKQLQAKGAQLIIRRGNPEAELAKLIAEANAQTVFWNRRYEPEAIASDSYIKRTLSQSGLELKSFHAHTLFEPTEVLNKQGQPYRVYSAFWRAYRSRGEPREPLAEPRLLQPFSESLRSGSLESLDLLPRTNWADNFPKHWTPGTTGAKNAARDFLKDAVYDYADKRNIPSVSATSMLSAHLAFGEISPQTLWQMTVKATNGALVPGVETFLKQLVWRDFSYHLLYHYPHISTQPLREKFKTFPWRDNEELFQSWKTGNTGYPIVDAGMRQLWQTGWMHNRVRMIVASFLVKHLLIPWQRGAEWFWDTLVDADLANNTMGWQWTAGCGADAAPYFRVFNPTLQGQRFDPTGEYVRRWVPELSALTSKNIHDPWNAPAEALAGAGVVLGNTYPLPIVEHVTARQSALEAYEMLQSAA